jgi:hypothetical protein
MYNVVSTWINSLQTDERYIIYNHIYGNMLFDEFGHLFCGGFTIGQICLKKTGKTFKIKLKIKFII